MHHYPLLLQAIAYSIIAFTHDTAQGILALLESEYINMCGI